MMRVLMTAVAAGWLVASTGSARAAPAPAATPGQPVGPGTVIEALSDSGELQRFRIDTVDPDPRDRDGDVRLYGVSIFQPGSNRWAAYCDPDLEGRSAAIPVQGSWTAQGDPQPGGTDKLTFACTSGAIAKCVRFGYKPWKSVNGVSLQPYHAACMRMVRADYCGDGRPHTVDGTWIDIWDSLGIQQREKRPGHPDVFEAAWSPTGAVYLNVPRWSDKVADVVKDCPKHFVGRTSKDVALRPAEVEKRFPEVLIFNARYVKPADRRAPVK